MNPSPEQQKILANFLLKLEGLKLKARFSRLEEGPVVTAYYFNLDVTESIKKILNKEEDFALAAHADKVVIERQGGEVVIFVPNKERKIVDFKDSLSWLLTFPETQEMILPITLGVDHLGQNQALDLVQMPHILIAGETGSGKSVYEAAILSGIVCKYTPDELKLYLVDTKQLDLPLFKTLPHVEEMVEDLLQFHRVFEALLRETRKRMAHIKGTGRNIFEYNKKQREVGGREFPYIVVMIDELADLIDQDRMERKAGGLKDKPTVSQWIKALVQICRAAGIHIIACTQRSSVKVIDGDIKANLPCRIALRLPTEADSRTILGSGGAENLLGKGDMLVQRPSSDVVQRYHGPFVDMNDIAHIITQHEYIRQSFQTQLLAKMMEK